MQGCSGLLELVKIPPTYECKKQVGYYKCIKVDYIIKKISIINI